MVRMRSKASANEELAVAEPCAVHGTPYVGMTADHAVKFLVGVAV